MLKEQPQGTELLVAGEFNSKLSELEGNRREEDIAAALVMEGLEDMSVHFLLLWRSWCWYGRTWRMIWEGREVWYQTDYILGTNCCLLWNVSVRDTRYNSYRYMVLGFFRSAPLREHTKYLGGRKRPPLRTPTSLTREDRIFLALRRAVLKPQARDARKNMWILEATWRLVNKRVSAVRSCEGPVPHSEVGTRHCGKSKGR